MKLHSNKTSKELFFFGKKPLIAHLHVFGSIIYVYNNKPNEGNWLFIVKNALFLVMMTRSKVIVVISHPPTMSLFLVMSRLWRLLIQSS
jgi:hypothetical protein